jgi:hypothetical protein
MKFEQHALDQCDIGPAKGKDEVVITSGFQVETQRDTDRSATPSSRTSKLNKYILFKGTLVWAIELCRRSLTEDVLQGDKAKESC